MSLSKIELEALEVKLEKVAAMRENLAVYRKQLSRRLSSHGLDDSAKRTLKAVGRLEAKIEAELDK